MEKKAYIVSRQKLLSYCTGSSVVVMLYSALYLISLWNPYSGLPNMQVAIVNLDTGPVNPKLASFDLGNIFQSLLFKPDTTWATTLAWQISPAITTRSQAIQQLEDTLIWAAIILPPSMSETFLANTSPSAQQQAQSLVKQNVTCEIIFNQGRSYSLENIMMNYIQYSLLNLSKDLARELINMSGQAGLSVSPGWIVEPLNLQITNLHPVRVFGVQLTTALFFFVLWLGSSIGVTAKNKEYYKRVTRKLGVSHARHKLGLIAYPILVEFVFVFAHALGAWSVVYAVNGSTSFSPNPKDSLAPLRTLIFLWYLGLCPLFINGILHQLLPANLYSVMSPLILVINLVSAGSLFDYVQAPDFFRYGYVLPMRYAVRQLKAMFFGSLSSTTTTNMAVLSVWILVPAAVYVGILHVRIGNYLREDGSFKV